jgi:hypothetical protein
MICALRLAMLGVLLALAGCVSPQSREAMRVLSDIDAMQELLERRIEGGGP